MSSHGHDSNAEHPRLAPWLDQAEASTSLRQPRETSSRLHRARTHIAAVACEACRSRKSKCNAERPACRACVQRKTPCQYVAEPLETHSQALKRRYDELHQSKVPYEELFDMLRFLPEKDSLEVLRRIRAGGEVDAILRYVKEGNLLLCPGSARSLIPI
ncbi:hypothetical protein F5884DRAFT_751273 [Xylogone sp. PMI_703]|nr:hypothetical protein F5884DRAFT_751273 [Xylogone sp. PMI_703]